jgi:hypothetical protein
MLGMAKLNRPKLATHYTGPRAGNRDFVSMEGRCSVGDGAPEDVAVLDLDARGCRIKGFNSAVTKADRLQVWLGAVGPIEGGIRWAKGGSAGIAFARQLGDEEMAEALRTATAAPLGEVIPLRRRVRLDP